MVTRMTDYSSGRRRFLRRSALVVGAFLLGVGRSETAFGSGCGSCRRKCTDEEKRNKCNNALSWVSPLGRNCVECYKSASAVEKAEREKQRRRLPHACNYCENVLCSYSSGSSGGGDDGDETAVPPVVDAGVGCIDPDTGAVIPWSEPGTPCDNRSPHDQLREGE